MSHCISSSSYRKSCFHILHLSSSLQSRILKKVALELLDVSLPACVLSIKHTPFSKIIGCAAMQLVILQSCIITSPFCTALHLPTKQSESKEYGISIKAAARDLRHKCRPHTQWVSPTSELMAQTYMHSFPTGTHQLDKSHAIHCYLNLKLLHRGMPGS